MKHPKVKDIEVGQTYWRIAGYDLNLYPKSMEVTEIEKDGATTLFRAKSSEFKASDLYLSFEDVIADLPARIKQAQADGIETAKDKRDASVARAKEVYADTVARLKDKDRMAEALEKVDAQAEEGETEKNHQFGWAAA